MFSMANVTLEGIRDFIIACAIIALCTGLLLSTTGCNSTLRVPDSPPKSVRPAVAVDESTGFFSWQFLARNGVMVHQSTRAFRERGDLLAHYANVRRLMVQAVRPTTITRAPDDNGRFRWSLYDEPTGERVEISDQAFATPNAARENYDDLRTAVLDCPPQDLDETTIPL